MSSRAARSVAGAVLGLVLTTWSAGWWGVPGVVVSRSRGIEVGSPSARSAARVEVRVRGAAWRPLIVVLGLAPATGAGPLQVAIGADGEPGRIVAIDGPTSVDVTLPRLRGLRRNDTIVLDAVSGHGPIEVTSARAHVAWTPSAWATLLYAAALGAWLGWRWPSRGRLPGGAGREAAGAYVIAESAGGLAVVALGVMLLRKPDALLLPQLWAEDGGVFFRGAWLFGWGAVTTSYAGYLHLLPRLVAGLAAGAPPASVPLLYTLGAMVPVVLVARLLASPRLELGRGDRLACALLLALPPMPGEVLLNLTNAQWILGFVFVLLLLARPAERAGGVAGDGALLALAGLTGPFSLVAAPFYVVRAVWRRSTGATVSALVVSITASIQGLILLGSRRLSLGDPAPFDVLVAQAGTRLAAALGFVVSEDAGFLIAGAVAGLLALFVLALVIERAWRPAVCVGGGLVVAVIVMMALRGIAGGLSVGGERYFSLPTALVLWGCVLARRPFPRLATATLGLVLLLAAAALCVPPLPDLRWREASACLSMPETSCAIPINPAGWRIDLPPRR